MSAVLYQSLHVQSESEIWHAIPDPHAHDSDALSVKVLPGASSSPIRLISPP